MPVPEPRVLSDFAGRWQVVRKITAKAAPDATFEGTALWTPQGTGLAYSETGVMRLSGHPPMQAARRYFWAEDLAVYFEDGRFFHQVPRAGGQTQHWCDPDRYRVVYDFSGWPQFRATWQVSGPCKDYVSDTLYTPC